MSLSWAFLGSHSVDTLGHGQPTQRGDVPQYLRTAPAVSESPRHPLHCTGGLVGTWDGYRGGHCPHTLWRARGQPSPLAPAGKHPTPQGHIPIPISWPTVERRFAAGDLSDGERWGAEPGLLPVISPSCSASSQVDCAASCFAVLLSFSLPVKAAASLSPSPGDCELVALVARILISFRNTPTSPVLVGT